jgi:hypothetical protein
MNIKSSNPTKSTIRFKLSIKITNYALLAVAIFHTRSNVVCSWQKVWMELIKRDKLDIVETKQIASEAVDKIVANPELLNDMEIKDELLAVIENPYKLAGLIGNAQCKKPPKPRKQTFVGIMTSKVKPDKQPHPRPRLSDS